MATGDQNDMMARMRAVLPTGWFPDEAPVLDSVLAGIGSAFAAVYAMIVYLIAQIRIATATGAMLDLIALDFFGYTLQRRPGESDDSLRLRIGEEMFRERGTRAAVIRVLTDLTGTPPFIFEPAYTYDTGGYGAASGAVGAGRGYGVAGGYGSLMLPFQFFVVAVRGSRSPIANVMGYGSLSVAGHWAGGGYGGGAIEYASLAWTQGQVTDAAMEAAVASVLPVATIAWMAIANTSPVPVPPNPVTGLAAG